MPRNNDDLPSGYRWMHCHPSLLLGHTLTVQAKREDPMRVFFKQSDIDGACGLHCLAMVCVILNLAKSHALTQMASRRYGVPSEVFREFGDDIYFTGVEPNDFVARVSRLNLPLRLSARYKNDPRLDSFAIENLRLGELVMLAFKSVKNLRTRHWALAVASSGIYAGRQTVTDTLYLLDPSADEPRFTLFNARLKIHQSRRNLVSHAHRKTPLIWLYDSEQWPAEQVRLIGAVRLSRR